MGITYYGKAETDGASPLVMDRYGLWTATFTRTVKTEEVASKFPRRKMDHPVYPWLQLEGARMNHRGPWTDIMMDFAGIRDNETEPEYELMGSLSTEPIEAHPDFEDILSTAGLVLEKASQNPAGVLDDDGQFRGFPKSVKESDTDGVAELFGVDSFLYPGAVWRKTYMTRRRPSDVKNLGRVDTPEGNPPTFDGGRNWLFHDFNYKERGKTFAVIKEWKLSGFGGANPLIYKAR